MITPKLIKEKLKKVIDPELYVDIVSLGLIYKVTVSPTESVHILMTLTSPGCPLAGVFGSMVKGALRDIKGLDVDKDVLVELTFDPPWSLELVSDEAKAELGF
jgi:metal-sulfur cluster biosynthetic enzyme